VNLLALPELENTKVEELKMRLVGLEKELEDQRMNATMVASDELVQIRTEWAERLNREKVKVRTSSGSKIITCRR